MTVRDDVLKFLRSPEEFAGSVSDPDIWLQGLEQFALPSIAAKSDRPLRPAQEAAWRGLASKRVGLVLGPPGTGKTHLLSWLIAGYAFARAATGQPARIFVTAFTRNAVGNVLDAVVKRQLLHAPTLPLPIYYGAAPDSGLSPSVTTLDRGDEADLMQAIASGQAVVGSTIWGLYRFLTSGAVPNTDGPTSPLFNLVCVDEASQMVLGQGLMALAGLAPGGRIVVAGDDQQLPPVRAAREVKIDGRELGGSLYSFLKTAEAAVFPLEETFRLNAPLAAFPERKFYPGRYFSAAPSEQLALRDDWADGLDTLGKVALDPAFPVVVLVHDGPPAATANPFEAKLAAELASALADRVVDAASGPVPPAVFWSEIAAVVSPHRAQNAAIRAALPERLRADAFVETVDRIQGKERDALILSYCVADAEFAVAEGDFIYSPERLNVATTRARTKLVLIISRRLLDAVPSDQGVMDNAETLREFVFSCAHRGEIEREGPGGRKVRLQVRTLGFEGDDRNVDLTPGPVMAPPGLGPMTSDLEVVLQAIRQESARSSFGSAALKDVRKALARPSDLFSEARALHHNGWISLMDRSKKGPSSYGPFWIAKPFEGARRVYGVDIETVRSRIALAVRDAKNGRHASYDQVRDRFAWMTESGDDAFLPGLQTLEQEGLLKLGAAGGGMTVEIRAAEQPAIDRPLRTDGHPVATADFVLLNKLEDMEQARINFGVFDAWTSAVELSRAATLAPDDATQALSRLEQAGYVMLAEDGRVRSRMAELAREIRLVKQRFRSDDADRRPYLVRSLKLEVRERRKPNRDLSMIAVLSKAADNASPSQRKALEVLSSALESLWGTDATLAAFQARGLEAGLAAWRGEGSRTLAIAADTGSGKTEAAVLPIIAGALGDGLDGKRGVRAILAYPRIRLAANQAQRLAGYLAACAGVSDMPPLTLGLQVGNVPDTFAGMHARYSELWPSAGPDKYAFPFFGCPRCGSKLALTAEGGQAGADALICSTGDWRFDGWIGSKDQLAKRPPSIFLPTTDSLHQWLHDPRYGAIFGDSKRFDAPRALLADEIHLYTHIHGAQVGATLRRLSERARLNDPQHSEMVAIGMSATIGDPAAAWGKLIGREDVQLVGPGPGESAANPRGREYFYFIQPEVESRGADIAGASTTIQSLMCMGHGMRRRTGDEGGYRSLVFFDSIDKMRRLHGAYIDAEEGRELAAYRINTFGDGANYQPQTQCCKEPVGCDRFADGECWWFAANDMEQEGPNGIRPPGTPLRVARKPVYSGSSSEADELVKGSDVVFATSSLEVGYDDPDITLVYQHYAPQNLASFIQRKGRGGRGLDDRPTTAVTLSLYSPRDSWWFRRPSEMVSPASFYAPLNPDNAFVRRGQAIATILDGLARWEYVHGSALNAHRAPVKDALESAGELVEAVFGPEVWSSFGVANVQAFWSAAPRTGGAVRYLSDLRQSLRWAPNALFDTINLPAVSVTGAGVVGGDREDISFALPTIAPGNATRRFSPSVVHWRPPAKDQRPGSQTVTISQPNAFPCALPRRRCCGIYLKKPGLFSPARLSICADLSP